MFETPELEHTNTWKLIISFPNPTLGHEINMDVSHGILNPGPTFQNETFFSEKRYTYVSHVYTPKKKREEKRGLLVNCRKAQRGKRKGGKSN